MEESKLISTGIQESGSSWARANHQNSSLVSTLVYLLLLRNSISAQERALPRELTNSVDKTYSVYTSQSRAGEQRALSKIRQWSRTELEVASAFCPKFSPLYPLCYKLLGTHHIFRVNFKLLYLAPVPT